jgi:hypothetical protein
VPYSAVGDVRKTAGARCRVPAVRANRLGVSPAPRGPIGSNPLVGYMNLWWYPLNWRSDRPADRRLAAVGGNAADRAASDLTQDDRTVGQDKDMPLLPWIDPENFNPGYLTRNMHLLPKRGDKPEWQHTQDYWTEKDTFPAIDLDDGVFVYG